MRTDISRVDVCLEGKIFRDSETCSAGKFAGSNVTFIMKEPRGWLHYEHIDSCREPIDRPHEFTICTKNKSENVDDLISDLDSITYSHVNHLKFSIKNNCKTPYCSKLVSSWAPIDDDTMKVLSYVSIDRKYFDPIVDPDLVNFKTTSN